MTPEQLKRATCAVVIAGIIGVPIVMTATMTSIKRELKAAEGNMRIIEFRGKSCDTGEWEYGGIAIDGKNCRIVQEGFKPTSTLVIPETVGQYTGLDDKNGVKIYEGDVVRAPKRYIVAVNERLPFCAHLYYVTWIDFEASFFYRACDDENNILSMACYPPGDMEVVGNVHDNPPEEAP